MRAAAVCEQWLVSATLQTRPPTAPSSRKCCCGGMQSWATTLINALCCMPSLVPRPATGRRLTLSTAICCSWYRQHNSATALTRGAGRSAARRGRSAVCQDVVQCSPDEHRADRQGYQRLSGSHQRAEGLSQCLDQQHSHKALYCRRTQKHTLQSQRTPARTQ